MRASRHGVAEVSPGQDGAGCGYRCGRCAHDASQVLSRRPGWALRARDGNGRRKTKPGVAGKRNLTRHAPRATATSPSRSPRSRPGPRAVIRAARPPRSLLCEARPGPMPSADLRGHCSENRPRSPTRPYTRVLPGLGLFWGLGHDQSRGPLLDCVPSPENPPPLRSSGFRGPAAPSPWIMGSTPISWTPEAVPLCASLWAEADGGRE